MIAKIHTDTIFFSADWESRGENVSVIRRKLQNLCKQAMMKMIQFDMWIGRIGGGRKRLMIQDSLWSAFTPSSCD